MKKDLLRIVDFWHETTPDKPIKGIFHKWIIKENGDTHALIEDFYNGKVVFIETKNLKFLNFWQTKDFWEEIKNKSLY